MPCSQLLCREPVATRRASKLLYGLFQCLLWFCKRVPLTSPLASDAGLSVSKRRRGGMAGTPHADLPVEPRFLGRAPPHRPLLPCQSWARRESSSSHMLAAHVVW